MKRTSRRGSSRRPTAAEWSRFFALVDVERAKGRWQRLREYRREQRERREAERRAREALERPEALPPGQRAFVLSLGEGPARARFRALTPAQRLAILAPHADGYDPIVRDFQVRTELGDGGWQE
jgi:hypothetical protein